MDGHSRWDRLGSFLFISEYPASFWASRLHLYAFVKAWTGPLGIFFIGYIEVRLCMAHYSVAAVERKSGYSYLSWLAAWCVALMRIPFRTSRLGSSKVFDGHSINDESFVLCVMSLTAAQDCSQTFHKILTGSDQMTLPKSWNPHGWTHADDNGAADRGQGWRLSNDAHAESAGGTGPRGEMWHGKR